MKVFKTVELYSTSTSYSQKFNQRSGYAKRPMFWAKLMIALSNESDGMTYRTTERRYYS